MKITVHIDDALLEAVRKEYGFESKTETINAALHEMDRRAKLRAFASAPSPFTPAELKESVVPGYDVLASRGIKIKRHAD